MSVSSHALGNNVATRALSAAAYNHHNHNDSDTNRRPEVVATDDTAAAVGGTSASAAPFSAALFRCLLAFLQPTNISVRIITTIAMTNLCHARAIAAAIRQRMYTVGLRSLDLRMLWVVVDHLMKAAPLVYGRIFAAGLGTLLDERVPWLASSSSAASNTNNSNYTNNNNSGIGSGVEEGDDGALAMTYIGWMLGLVTSWRGLLPPTEWVRIHVSLRQRRTRMLLDALEENNNDDGDGLGEEGSGGRLASSSSSLSLTATRSLLRSGTMSVEEEEAALVAAVAARGNGNNTNTNNNNNKDNNTNNNRGPKIASQRQIEGLQKSWEALLATLADATAKATDKEKEKALGTVRNNNNGDESTYLHNALRGGDDHQTLAKKRARAEEEEGPNSSSSATATVADEEDEDDDADFDLGTFDPNAVTYDSSGNPIMALQEIQLPAEAREKRKRR